MCVSCCTILYAAVTGRCGKGTGRRYAYHFVSCEIYAAGIFLRSADRYRTGICLCDHDGQIPYHGSGILSDHDYYPDNSNRAIAPILVLWMGFGMAPKITLVVITTFFPITIGLLDGYKSVDQDAIRLLQAMGANRLQIFFHVKFPFALPQFFSGLKISASYAVVGAVVSEWLGGFNGLGVYMTRVKKAYAFDKMFAVIIFIVVISLLLLLAVNVIRHFAMPWLNVGHDTKK